jgi:hypothetical protein
MTIHIENIGEMAVIECEGRIVRSEAAIELRKAVHLQSDARIIVLDLSEVNSCSDGLTITTFDLSCSTLVRRCSTAWSTPVRCETSTSLR